ncbi:MAG: hypothetical protein ACYDHY_09995 [Acidiferrobacterales bacterium]
MADNVPEGLESLIALLAGYRYPVITERALQDGIEVVLREGQIPYAREAALNSSDRPDFLLPDGTAIEIKIKGSLAEALRQVHRYAGSPRVTALLVVGTPHWLPRLPERIGGKPMRSLRLLGSLL